MVGVPLLLGIAYIGVPLYRWSPICRGWNFSGDSLFRAERARGPARGEQASAGRASEGASEGGAWASDRRASEREGEEGASERVSEGGQA